MPVTNTCTNLAANRWKRRQAALKIHFLQIALIKASTIRQNEAHYWLSFVCVIIDICAASQNGEIGKNQHHPYRTFFHFSAPDE